MKRHVGIALIISILLLGAVLRMYRLRDLATFRGDQAIELQSAADILHGKFTLIGIKTSISEVRNGAVMYYIYAPFLYLFNYDPIAGAAVATLLSLSAVVVTYYIGAKFIHKRVGLLASFFIAASPLLVKFSRQNLLAFSPLLFSAVALYLLGSISRVFKKWHVLLLGIVLGISLQVHYSTLSLCFAAFVFPFIFLSIKQKIFYFAILFIGFVIGLSPLLVFELRHEFFNAKMFLAHASNGQSTTIMMGESFSYIVHALSQYFFAERKIIAILAVVLMVNFAVWNRRKPTKIETVLLLQIISTIVFVIIFVRQTVPHYIVNAVIPFALLSTIVFDSIIVTKKKVLSFSAIALLFFLLNIPSYGLTDSSGWTMDRGWSLPGVEKASKIIADDFTTSQFNVVMRVDAENQGYPLRYFLTQWGKPPMVVEHYDSPTYLYVVARSVEDIKKDNLFEITSFGDFTIEKTWDIQPGYYLYRLSKTAV